MADNITEIDFSQTLYSVLQFVIGILHDVFEIVDNIIIFKAGSFKFSLLSLIITVIIIALIIEVLFVNFSAGGDIDE